MENMKIVIISGGLGNQLYQYTFARFLETTINEKCIMDDSCFWGDKIQHNGYEMEKVFHLKLNLLSNYFSEDVWAEMLKLRDQGISIPQQLLNNGINLTMLAEFQDHPKFDGNIVYMPPNSIAPETLQIYLNTKGAFYYHGYWVRREFVWHMRKILLKELVFPDICSVPGLPEINKEYAERIRESDSVAVHIRRGDFLACGRALPPEKYARAVEIMEEKHGGGSYFIFSDDIVWCQEHAKELGLDNIKGEVVYVVGNTGNGYNYVDMQLMSMCKKMIISNSSFGAWASYLNVTPDWVVVVADAV